MVWPFTDYGGFASGGLSLGNVVFEVLRPSNAPTIRTEEAVFWGVAFEPTGDASSAVSWMDERGLAHSPPRPGPNATQVLWETVHVTDLLPNSARIFVCDYKAREQVRGGRTAASRQLMENGGGPLGITGVAELVIGHTAITAGLETWSLFVGQARVGPQRLLAFSEGPNVRLVSSDVDGVREIVLTVNSLAAAERYLRVENLLGSEEGERITIAPERLQGLRIILEEDEQS